MLSVLKKQKNKTTKHVTMGQNFRTVKLIRLLLQHFAQMQVEGNNTRVDPVGGSMKKKQSTTYFKMQFKMLNLNSKLDSILYIYI